MSTDLRISSNHCGGWEKARKLCSKQAPGGSSKEVSSPLGEFLHVTELSRSIRVCDRETAGPQAHRLKKGKGVCRERWELGPKTEQWQPSKEYSYFHITLILLNMRSECKITQYSTI